jgi:hypothetical protein
MALNASAFLKARPRTKRDKVQISATAADIDEQQNRACCEDQPRPLHNRIVMLFANTVDCFRTAAPRSVSPWFGRIAQRRGSSGL